MVILTLPGPWERSQAEFAPSQLLSEAVAFVPLLNPW